MCAGTVVEGPAKGPPPQSPKDFLPILKEGGLQNHDGRLQRQLASHVTLLLVASLPRFRSVVLFRVAIRASISFASHNDDLIEVKTPTAPPVASYMNEMRCFLTMLEATPHRNE